MMYECKTCFIIKGSDTCLCSGEVEKMTTKEETQKALEELNASIRYEYGYLEKRGLDKIKAAPQSHTAPDDASVMSTIDRLENYPFASKIVEARVHTLINYIRATTERGQDEPKGKTCRVWRCAKSPTGYCEYDEEEDPAMDSCLHCGDPFERK